MYVHVYSFYFPQFPLATYETHQLVLVFFGGST